MRPRPSLSNSLPGKSSGRHSGGEGGFSLIEILIVLAVMGVVAAFIFPSFWQFQDQGVKEINKNDLYDRAQRLGIFVERDLVMAGFLLGRRPDPAININGTSYAATIVVDNHDNADDRITILRSESFFPKLTCSSDVAAGVTAVAATVPEALFTGLSGHDDRRARLGVEADSAYNNIAFENHKRAYRLTVPDNGLTISSTAGGLFPVVFNLAVGLRESLSAGSEILRVRSRQFSIVNSGGESQLRVNDGKSNDILDRAVQGLQVRYLLESGSWDDNPARAEEIRGIRVYLLVRDIKPQKGLKNPVDYSSQMGPNVSGGTYGPYNDAFARVVVVKDVEVKNYAAR